VRDVFLFAVYTGQRWSDVHGFNAEDVENHVWIFEAQKTGKITRVPMVGFAAPAELDYQVNDTTTAADILDTEITGYEVVDSV